jgi:hypothetical protein
LSKPELKQKETYQYREQRIGIGATAKTRKELVMLTYWTENTAPRTIWLPAEGYDDKARTKAIVEDQEKLKSVKTGTVTV